MARIRSLVAGILGSGLLLASSSTAACVCFYSEASHALFGAFMGGSLTWVADEVGWREHRALIGFGVTTAGGLLEEAASKSGFSIADAGFNMLGAAVGAYVTDRYLLAPVVQRQADGHRFVGVILTGRL
jgi:hypothetical protein